MTTGKRGKPSLSEQQLRRLIIAHSPSEIAPRVFPSVDQRFVLVEPLDIAAKCSDIAKKVENAVQTAIGEADAASTPAVAVRASYPSLLAGSPENVILEAERAATVNEQAVSALMAHLVNHLIIGEGLKQIAMQARDEVVEKLDDIPQEFKDFCVKLQVKGVTDTHVHRLSKRRLRQVVDLIKGFKGNGDEDAHVNGDDGLGQDETGDELASSAPNSTELAEFGRDGEETSSTKLHENSELSADSSGTVVDPLSDAMAARAAVLGYEVFERVAVTSADLGVLTAPASPEELDPHSLATTGIDRVRLMNMSMTCEMPMAENIIMKRWAADSSPHADDTELAKRWSWTLFGMDAEGQPSKYPKGWWDGLVLPSPAPKAGYVRQLRHKG